MKYTYYLCEVYFESFFSIEEARCCSCFRESFEEAQLFLKAELVKIPNLAGFAISPCHVEKKWHFHLILRFDSSVTLSAVLKAFSSAPDYLPANKHFEACANLNQASCYLCHIGFDDKPQYRIDDCFLYNVPKIKKALFSSVDSRSFFADILQVCNDNDIVEICDLIDFAYNYLSDFEIDFILKNFSKFDRYLASKRYKRKPVTVVEVINQPPTE